MQIIAEKKQISTQKPRRGWLANQLNQKAKQLALTEDVIPYYEFTEALKNLEDARNI